MDGRRGGGRLLAGLRPDEPARDRVAGLTVAAMLVPQAMACDQRLRGRMHLELPGAFAALEGVGGGPDGFPEPVGGRPRARG